MICYDLQNLKPLVNGCEIKCSYFDFPKKDSKSSILLIPFMELSLEFALFEALGEVFKPAEAPLLGAE